MDNAGISHSWLDLYTDAMCEMAPRLMSAKSSTCWSVSLKYGLRLTDAQTAAATTMCSQICHSIANSSLEYPNENYSSTSTAAAVQHQRDMVENKARE
jgi:hypothetical protein